MSEFFYTRILVILTEDDVIINEKKKRSKISFKNVRQIFESYDNDDKSCIVIEYHDQSFTTIYDDFERIDKLHDKYLANDKSRA